MIDPSLVTACLITRESEYPEELLTPITTAHFADILIYTHCPSIAGRLDLFKQAATPFIFTQDDDSLTDIPYLLQHANPDQISTLMSDNHIAWYSTRRHCLLNWGAILPTTVLTALPRYTDRYGFDPLFLREFDRILTGLNFPQLRIPFPTVSLPSAWLPHRLSHDPKHFDFMSQAEARLQELL